MRVITTVLVHVVLEDDRSQPGKAATSRNRSPWRWSDKSDSTLTLTQFGCGPAALRRAWAQLVTPVRR